APSRAEHHPITTRPARVRRTGVGPGGRRTTRVHPRRDDTMTTLTSATAPVVSARVSELHARMTLDEKLAQIVGFWVDQGGEVVAPMQSEMADGGDAAPGEKLLEATRHGLGHLTRVYGTRPVEPAERAAWLRDTQRRLVTETR